MEGRDIVREANLDEVQKAGGKGLGYVKTIGMESHTPSNLGPVGEKMTPAQRAHLGIAHVPEGRHVFPDMSVQDNLLTGAWNLRGSRSIRTFRCFTAPLRKGTGTRRRSIRAKRRWAFTKAMA